MLTLSTVNVAKSAVNARMFSSSASRMTKVAVLGAGGGIGQPLSLLLKTDPLVSSLNLYDIRGAPGVAADVSHVDTSSKVGDQSATAVFNRALISTISTVPIVGSVFKNAGTFDPRRLFGITTLDVVRASQFTSSLVPSATAETTVVPVVGGHSGVTIVPILSQSAIGKQIQSGSEAWKALVHRIQFGGDEVVKAKDGAGSATLSMAFAAAKFTNLLLKALGGEKGLVTPTFVESPLYANRGVSWFSSNVELGKNGVEKIHEVGVVTPEEEALIEACLPELKKNIEKGENFVKNS
ncbi:Malate dehydrogenase, cytoplasmic [Tulasnella sp. 418]|nr:Malate dehydrogenase, cytoplasmic [Tulasnella sp. 418]